MQRQQEFSNSGVGAAASPPTRPRLRVLVLAVQANPDWVSVPLLGWRHAEALRQVADVTLVTHKNNAAAIDAWMQRHETRFPVVYFTGGLIDDVALNLSKRLMQRTGGGAMWTLITAMHVPANWFFEWRVWRHFRHKLRAGEFDLVHRLTPVSPTIASPIAAKCKSIGVPFILGPINGGVPWPKEFSQLSRRESEWLAFLRPLARLAPFYRSSRRSAKALILGSRSALREVDQAYKSKSFFLPENGIDPGETPDFTRFAAPLPIRLAFAGRLVPLKGVDILIDAVAPLVRSGRCRLDIYGDGFILADLQRQIAAAGIDEGVTLHGWVKRDDMLSRLRSAHVFAFPSLREFGGGAVLEAMALGLVPVVMDYGGPGDLVTPKTGVLIPMGPRASIVEHLQAALARLTEDTPEARQQLNDFAVAAHSRATEGFSWAAKAQALLAIYQWALGLAPPRADLLPAPEKHPG